MGKQKEDETDAYVSTNLVGVARRRLLVRMLCHCSELFCEQLRNLRPAGACAAVALRTRTDVQEEILRTDADSDCAAWKVLILVCCQLASPCHTFHACGMHVMPDALLKQNAALNSRATILEDDVDAPQDAVTVKIFSSICKVSDCVDHNIALIEDLNKNRTPMPETAGKSRCSLGLHP